MFHYANQIFTNTGRLGNAATVDVFLTGTSTRPTIYSDDGVTTKANPITADAYGRFDFYVADGRYDIRVTGTGITTYTLSNIEIADTQKTPTYRADEFQGADAGAKIAAAIAALPATGGTVDASAFEGAQTIATLITISKPVVITFGNATYTCSAAQTFQFSSRGIALLGVGTPASFNTDGSGNGTIFKVSTAGGSFVVMGSDNGHAYDAADYDGFGGARFENLQIVNSGAATALSNGKGNFGNGSYAIRDWRGGGMVINHIAISHFQYGIWGIQSDLNDFNGLYLQYNSVGCFLGPRSDQNTILHGYSFWNDTAFQLDGAWNAKFIGYTTDSDGSTTTPAFKLMGTYTRGTSDISFNDCWFENYGGAAAAYEAFVEIGVGATTKVTNVVFKDPIILTAVAATPRTDYLAEIDNGDSIHILRPKDRGDNSSMQLTALLEFTGATSQTKIFIEQARHSFTTSVNNGSGTQAITVVEYTSSTTTAGRMNLTGQLRILSEGVNAPQITMVDSDNTGSQTAFRNNFNASNTSFQIDPLTASGTDSADIRMFRSTNTTGLKRLVIFKGDNTATERFAVNADSGDTDLRRVKASKGTALVAGDFALSAGWGSTAAVSAVTGTDQGWQITVTANGAGIAANPTITLTFKDGTWTNAPVCVTKMASGTGVVTALTEVPTATTNVITFNGTPVAASTYIISSIAMGR